MVTARDRVATTARTIEHVLATTTDTDPVVVVLGGVSDRLRRDLERRFRVPRLRFSFHPDPLDPASGRNIGLTLLDTELAAIIDTDVVPREGWLDALVSCQQSTGASLVVPIILERQHSIHCAGNDFYIDEVDGVRMGHKELRLFQKPYHDSSNLRRCRSDYGELHCQLVRRQVHLDLHAFDEAILEGGEVDQSLVLRSAGHDVWFEPEAVVLFDRFAPITVDDIDQYCKKWHTESIVSGLEHFFTKWGVDLSEQGHFFVFLSDTNSLLGKLPRRFKREWVLKLSQRAAGITGRVARLPHRTLVQRRRRRWQLADWQRWVNEVSTKTGVPEHPVLATLGARDRAAKPEPELAN